MQYEQTPIGSFFPFYNLSEQNEDEHFKNEVNLDDEGNTNFDAKKETEHKVVDKKIFNIIKDSEKKTKEDDIMTIEEEKFIIYNEIINDYAKDYIPEPKVEIIYKIDEKIKGEFSKSLYKEGSIYKKLKEKMFEQINHILQKKFEEFGIKIKFSFRDICQNEVKEHNKTYLNMTLKKLLTILKNQNGKYVLDNEKKNILEKLENDENDKKIGKMLKMKLEDIYNEFIRSNEFQELIKKLRDEDKYGYAYIHFVVKKAKNFVAYYKGKKQE